MLSGHATYALSLICTFQSRHTTWLQAWSGWVVGSGCLWLQAGWTGAASQQVSHQPAPPAPVSHQLSTVQQLQPPATNPGTVQSLGQGHPSLSAQQHPGSGTISPAAQGQSPQPDPAALNAQGSGAADPTWPSSAGGKKGDGSPPGSAGRPEGGSPEAGDGGGPSKHVRMMTGILEVLAREVLNPASTKETRDAAHTCLQVWQLASV